MTKAEERKLLHDKRQTKNLELKSHVGLEFYDIEKW